MDEGQLMDAQNPFPPEMAATINDVLRGVRGTHEPEELIRVLEVSITVHLPSGKEPQVMSFTQCPERQAFELAPFISTAAIIEQVREAIDKWLSAGALAMLAISRSRGEPTQVELHTVGQTPEETGIKSAKDIPTK